MEINKIYNEDCIEGMKKLKDWEVSISVTSPPYNVGGKYLHFKDKSCYCDYYIFIRNVLDELLRVTKNYVFFNFAILENNKDAYLKLMSNYHENIKEIFIWAKPSSQPNNAKVCRTGFEFIVCFARKEIAKTRSFDIFNTPNVSNTIIKGANKENKLKNHEACYSLWLPEFFISNFSNIGDLVLDPFMGSGTTAVACKRLSRNYIGFEIEKEYYDYSIKRIKNVPSKLEKFAITEDEDI